MPPQLETWGGESPPRPPPPASYAYAGHAPIHNTHLHYSNVDCYRQFPCTNDTISCFTALYHGDTIGLQSFTRNLWVGCPRSSCGPAGCPRMHMTGSDWTNCWGEVFRIYRASGPGLVRAGDVVGLYYPRESGKWFGCPGSSCSKKTCPGYPTTVNGFATQDKWLQCWGEVFRIYAKGKGNYAVINSCDDISLYYVYGKSWVAQEPGNTDKRTCLGNTRPPAYSTYDGCAWETLRIWKRE